MKPLEQLRVIDLGLGPITGLATMVLADFGADVIKIEPPGGDPYRSLPSSRLWLRGKSTITVDFHDDAQLAQLKALIRDTADGVVTTLKKGKREGYGLDYAALCEGRPDLIYGSISGFGETGPYADYLGYEGIVAAKSGRMMSFEGSAGHAGPNYAALQVGIHATAQSVAAALMSAFHARLKSGKGFSFETSLLRGLLPYDMGGLQTQQLAERGVIDRPQGRQDPKAAMPRIYYHGARTRDGRWIQFGNLLPHLQTNFLRAAGIEVDEGGIPEGGDALEEFRNRMLARIEQLDLDEWMDIFVADGGVVAHQYQTTQQALSDPDVVDNGHAVEVDDGIQLGLVANLGSTPGEVGGPAVATTLEAAQEATPTRTLPVPEGNGKGPKRPLEGITVVEAATIIAAPLGASMLADLGARVIKFEPINGDPFRAMMLGIGASRCNTGKESICLDLKSAEGQAIAQEIVANADVFIHNYRPGVPEKLGLGYETLAATNPGLVYISANGYGPFGPGAKRPSTHPIPGAAMGGVVWQMGGLPGPGPMSVDEVREITRRLFRANEVNPDPNTSVVVATTAALGVLARDFTGQGQKIYIDMFGANAYANWDDFLSYPNKPARAEVDREQLGLGPRYRIYQCASGWVFLAVTSDEQWEQLGVADEAALEALFKSDDADAWEKKLIAQGIACVRADAGWPADFLLTDPHAREEELVVSANHGEWGEYLRHGPMVMFERGDTYAGACLAGDSTVSLLEELGYEAPAIDALIEAGTVLQLEA